MLDTHLYRHEEILITLLPGFRALNTNNQIWFYDLHLPGFIALPGFKHLWGFDGIGGGRALNQGRIISTLLPVLGTFVHPSDNKREHWH